MMRPGTIRIVAIALVLMVCMAAALGWDPVFNQHIVSHWLPRMNVCF